MQNFLNQLVIAYSNFDYSLFFYLIAFFSVLVVSVSKSGFGGSLGGLGVPIMLFILPAKFVLAVFLPLIILTDIWVVYVWRKFPVYKIVIIMCAGGIIGQIIGWLVFDYFNDSTIVIIIAVLAIATSFRYYKNLFLQNKGKSKSIKLKLDIKKGVGWCSLSGFSSFVALTGGIPAQIFLLPLRLDRKKFVATMGFYFCFINFMKIPFFFNLNIISFKTIAFSILMLPIIPIGIFFGKWLNKKLTDKLFYHFTHAALFVCGINLIIKELY